MPILLNMKHLKKSKTPILIYHDVAKLSERSKKIRGTNPVYCLTVERFRDQMEFLHRNEYQTLGLNEIIDLDSKEDSKRVALTFDDGWKNTYTNAFPVLKGYHMSATIFVITGSIGQPEYLDWDQLREMSGEGVSVQSHTVTHRSLVGLKNEQMLCELEGSKKTIEDNLGKEVNFLSVPHGMINRKVINVAQTLGYKGICTSEPGFSHSYSSTAILKRINIPDNCRISTFEKIVQANQAIILPAVFSKKVKNLIKTVVGYQNYRKIYRHWYRIENY